MLLQCPWSLELAKRCTSMTSGILTHLPIEGTASEQPQWVLDCLEHARCVWMITVYKLAQGVQITEEDDAFMVWVMSKDDTDG